MILSLSSGMKLSKHHQYITGPTNEESVIIQNNQDDSLDTDKNVIKQTTTQNKGCGSASLTCLTFASDKSVFPVRCGVLTEVPLCLNQENDCTVFCDTDGGGRLCSIAFSDCCGHSKNGCISSYPLNTKYT
ncbi:unnamed protein product [Cunninghamella blakesleeana]